MSRRKPPAGPDYPAGADHSAERMRQLAAAAQGYIYYVSMTGVTGAQKFSPADIRAAVEELKTMTAVPVGVGFGITTAEEAASVGEFAMVLWLAAHWLEL